MKIHQLKTNQKRKNKTRLGRGNAGKGGTTAGRGYKGQKSRSGFNIPTGFEGGQTKLIQRLPKKAGFKSFKTKPTIVKTSQINKNFKSNEILSIENFIKKGLVDKRVKSVKILFDEKLAKTYTVKDVKFSKKVESQIKAK